VETYERPDLIATYSIEELRAEAATAFCYTVTAVSDRILKTEIETIEQPLERLGAIDTV